MARSRFWLARRITFASALAPLLWVCSAPVQASQTGTLGGNGGTPFQFTCPAGSYLAGIRARAGQVVDHVGAVCAAWDPRHAAAGPPRDMRAEFGGTGGLWTRFGCPAGSALAGWTIEQSYGDSPTVVGSLSAPQCRSLAKPARAVPTEDHLIGHRQGRSGFPAHFSIAENITCPGGQVGVGIFGGAGSYVDRIGLICAAPAKAGR